MDKTLAQDHWLLEQDSLFDTPVFPALEHEDNIMDALLNVFEYGGRNLGPENIGVQLKKDSAIWRTHWPLGSIY